MTDTRESALAAEFWQLARARDESLRHVQVKLTYVATEARTLTHYGRVLPIPVVPPVQLAEGESIELWLVLGEGTCRYEHGGTRNGQHS